MWHVRVAWKVAQPHHRSSRGPVSDVPMPSSFSPAVDPLHNTNQGPSPHFICTCEWKLSEFVHQDRSGLKETIKPLSFRHPFGFWCAWKSTNEGQGPMCWDFLESFSLVVLAKLIGEKIEWSHILKNRVAGAAVSTVAMTWYDDLRDEWSPCMCINNITSC
jgi:hypothetical protein